MSSQFPEIILFSPVKQTSDILRFFLDALGRLSYPGKFSCWFYDDNDQAASSQMLLDFCKEKNGNILPPLPLGNSNYRKNEETHVWDLSTIDRVTAIKNLAINFFLQTDAEYLFLVDSDVILQPRTLETLLEAQVYIISEVYWTQWHKKGQEATPYLPNVWDIHGSYYTSLESVFRLAEPGVYRVGGLGACTLIHRSVLELGVNFSKIPGLALWGEDRYFCVRASCFGIGLYADTHVTPFHLYRSSLIPECQEWIQEGCSTEYFKKWLNDTWKQQVQAYFLKQVRT